jgi:hypothetical protein
MRDRAWPPPTPRARIDAATQLSFSTLRFRRFEVRDLNLIEWILADHRVGPHVLRLVLHRPCVCSPDGKRLVLNGLDENDEPALFVVKQNGSGLRQLTPTDMIVDGDSGASWSPSGNHILFGGRADQDHRRGIFVVNADGTGFHQVSIPGCGGASSDVQSIACFGPRWSPDGTNVVFVEATHRFNPVQNVYMANADGSDLSRSRTTAAVLKSRR